MLTSGIESLVEVRRARTPVEAEEHALVLVAMGIQCLLLREPEAIAVLVAAPDAPRARHELDLYAMENRQSTVSLTAPEHSGGVEAAVLFAATLLFVHLWAYRDAFGHNWLSAGTAQASLILSGEWWRTITALGLHGDAAHLFSNIVFGGVFGVLLARTLGAGLTWFTIVLTAAMANALNAWAQSPGHSAIGASTAVFAALGILSGLMLMRPKRHRWKGLRRWAPLAAGAMLLAFLGTGGERTDIGAHVAGFGTGSIVGVILSRVEHRVPRSFQAQAFYGCAALGVFALAWSTAFSV